LSNKKVNKMRDAGIWQRLSERDRLLSGTGGEAIEMFLRGWCLDGQAFQRQKFEAMEGKTGGTSFRGTAPANGGRSAGLAGTGIVSAAQE
jgi:hypothetical protein